jgi:hypothetical protein
MRVAIVALIMGLALSACAEEKPIVVIPQGATVVCPNGKTATFSDGAYRC